MRWAKISVHCLNRNFRDYSPSQPTASGSTCWQHSLFCLTLNSGRGGVPGKKMQLFRERLGPEEKTVNVLPQYTLTVLFVLGRGSVHNNY